MYRLLVVYVAGVCVVKVFKYGIGVRNLGVWASASKEANRDSGRQTKRAKMGGQGTWLGVYVIVAMVSLLAASLRRPKQLRKTLQRRCRLVSAYLCA